MQQNKHYTIIASTPGIWGGLTKALSLNGIVAIISFQSISEVDDCFKKEKI